MVQSTAIEESSSRIQDIEGYVRSQNINVVEAPKADEESCLTHFSQEDENFLADNIGHYENVNACFNDALAISGVIRKRESMTLRNILESKHIFITESPRLAKYSFQHLKRQNYFDESIAAPPCITTRFLACVMWLSVGSDQFTKLSEHELLANCAKAANPSENLISKVKSTLKIVDSDSLPYFEALITDERAVHILMEDTLGDSDLVTENNIIEIYQDIAYSVAEEVRQEKDKHIEQIEEDLESERKEKQELQQMTNTLQSQIKSIYASQIQSILNKGNNLESAFKFIIFSFFIILGAILCFPQTLPFVSYSNSNLSTYLQPIGSLILFYLGLIQYFYKISIIPIQIPKYIAKSYVKKELNRLKLDIGSLSCNIDFDNWNVKIEY